MDTHVNKDPLNPINQQPDKKQNIVIFAMLKSQKLILLKIQILAKVVTMK